MGMLDATSSGEDSSVRSMKGQDWEVLLGPGVAFNRLDAPVTGPGGSAEIGASALLRLCAGVST